MLDLRLQCSTPKNLPGISPKFGGKNEEAAGEPVYRPFSNDVAKDMGTFTNRPEHFVPSPYRQFDHLREKETLQATGDIRGGVDFSAPPWASQTDVPRGFGGTFAGTRADSLSFSPIRGGGNVQSSGTVLRPLLGPKGGGGGLSPIHANMRGQQQGEKVKQAMVTSQNAATTHAQRLKLVERCDFLHRQQDVLTETVVDVYRLLFSNCFGVEAVPDISQIPHTILGEGAQSRYGSPSHVGGSVSPFAAATPLQQPLLGESEEKDKDKPQTQHPTIAFSPIAFARSPSGASSPQPKDPPNPSSPGPVTATQQQSHVSPPMHLSFQNVQRPPPTPYKEATLPLALSRPGPSNEKDGVEEERETPVQANKMSPRSTPPPQPPKLSSPESPVINRLTPKGGLGLSSAPKELSTKWPPAPATTSSPPKRTPISTPLNQSEAAPAQQKAVPPKTSLPPPPKPPPSSPPKSKAMPPPPKSKTGSPPPASKTSLPLKAKQPIPLKAKTPSPPPQKTDNVSSEEKPESTPVHKAPPPPATKKQAPPP
eukprot:Cvel_21081.t1-p1 / transcript=Cvel_21081.t1 / gene=Cvel_21081 / organism=Chromera_velia_CCMP2878 / gene_product=hypothetical protein / transcript_product=hypothetical protein / location=Cvel_scaffold1948:30470-36209(+) / protein_length=537 / sequence_SO=supercontig / SO=protein_coding / is_pseudo=false